MSSLTSESAGFNGIVHDFGHVFEVLLRRLFQPGTLQETEETVHYVRYLMIPEPVTEREFLIGNKRIILYVGDENDEVMFDFRKNPKVPYVLSHDVSASEDIMIINVPLMARAAWVPDGEEFDMNELQFTGPDYMRSTIEAFVRGDIRYTYPGNIDKKV